MTSISIAVKKETPQVVGPFTVTAAEMSAASGGGYASGVPLFTPAVDSLVLAAWSRVTETWVTTDTGTGLILNDADGAGPVPTTIVGSAGASSATSVGMSLGATEIRAYPASTFAGTAGATKVWFLVVPTG